MISKIQGILSQKLFHGISDNETIKKVYGESADLFSDILKKEFLNDKAYTVLDIGSHRGEFLSDLLEKMSDFEFETTAVEINKQDLIENIADNKILSDLKDIPLKDKSFDITLARYVLAWNNFENQRKIISEVKRLTKGIAIIQHQGSDNRNSDILKKQSEILFSGIVPLLKREEFYFSNEQEIENILKELNIKYSIVQSRKIEGLAELLIEKYVLINQDAKNVREILKKSNYIYQSTFILDFRS